MVEMDGASLVPQDGALDITALDVIVISSLRDIPVLFEGETGVGKTYTSQSFLRTVFPRESTVSLRLSGNTFLNNIFQPFLEGGIEKGMPVTRIKQSAVESIAGMFVDEINRGDPQSVLQLLDNELYNAGEFVKLGIRIPDLKAGGVYPGKRRKKLAILTAQNPATSADAKFTSTLELDAAVDNRLLKVNFGNAASSAGTTLWLEEEPRDPHEDLLAAFADLASRWLAIDRSTFAGTGNDWLSLYAWLADPMWTDKPILYTALELADVLICALGGSLAKAYEHEREVVRRWTAELGIRPLPDLDFAETERAKKLQELLKTFKVPVIFRDIVQIKKLADVIATLKTIKQASRAADPVAAYLATKRVVTVCEVAGGAALLTRNKQVSGAPSAVPAVNEVLVQYAGLVARAQDLTGYLPAGFNVADAKTGIKKAVLTRALRDSGGAAPRFVESVIGFAGKLLADLSATEDLRNLILMRTAADLLTLCGFLREREKEAGAVLKAAGGDLPEAAGRLADLYHREREASPLTIPEVYQHRVLRTLGG
jgi:hypothetical protein